MKAIAQIFIILVGFSPLAAAEPHWPLPCQQTLRHPLCQVAHEQSGPFAPRRLPSGFQSHRLSESKAQTLLERWTKILQLFEHEAQNLWENYVEAEWAIHQSGEQSQFEFESESDKDFFKQHPQLTLGLPEDSPLNTFEDLHQIFHRGRLIGYALDLNRQVRAEIIQDGSGYVLYFNLQGKLLDLTDWDS